MAAEGSKNECYDPNCACYGGVPRRDFLKLAGLGLTAAWIGRPVIAGPFEDKEFEQLVPSDKKLKPEWVKSIYERGEPTVNRGAELEKIGMPVGGICAGQLYLNGDGKLWHWDIFNLPQPGNFCSTGGVNYKTPPKPESPIEQGFAIKVTSGGKSQARSLDSKGFKPENIGFKGQYPMAFIDYRDDEMPVTVALEAFSPFVPLNVADSELPATIMRYTIKNIAKEAVEVEVAGWLENAVCLNSGKSHLGSRANRVLREQGATILECTAKAQPKEEQPAKRPEIVFEDFENGYGNWKVEGEAFGTEPATGAFPNQQPVSGYAGRKLVNSYLKGDDSTGKLTSKPFTIERRFVTFLIGGGKQAGKTCINLVIDGSKARSATGLDSEQLQQNFWDVNDLAGKQACIEIVDAATGPWGHVNVDQIVFADEIPGGLLDLDKQDDYGSLALAVLGDGKEHFGALKVPENPAQSVFDQNRDRKGADEEQRAPFAEKLIGGVGRKFTLAPGAQADATFVVAWYFPQPQRKRFTSLVDAPKLKKSYGKRFESATAVAKHVATNFDQLAGQTRLWNRTWYDSTLPYWFLDRTFIPICTLATSTCYHFDSGRFYAFEGVYCCDGTCQHVWNYAQSLARIFPELERDLRARTDFGTAWHDNGAIDYRGEYGRHVAHDGQCGVILRAYREHLTAADDSYLKQCWPRIKKSVEFLIGCDGDENGILEGEQYNTLDAAWFGPMAWISSFYIAALRAGEAMAKDAGDTDFAARCAKIAASGSSELVKSLYNGEYFIHKPDPKHPQATNTNDGCHIDQLMGQAWALQVGLPRIAPVKETLSALESIWKYNFTPDVGPFREKSKIKGGRWYAMAGEGGLVMTAFPRGGAEKASGKAFAYYFNEVWTGQEHQVIGHMLWEGMTEKAMILERVLHDRHHASRHNPFNEVECSDHYSRAMSSHGVFTAACGFEYHGPKGYVAFAPRLSPENFKAAFTGAEGWGTFSQKREGQSQRASLDLKWGKLKLKTIALELPANAKPAKVTVTVGGNAVAAQHAVEGSRAMITLAEAANLQAGQVMEIALA
ncbi:MAG TPA: GH116 family glycosyl-hydrolase [Planctomycetota bacterium]|jgi:uncharacterized protein (DUF608 family)